MIRSAAWTCPRIAVIGCGAAAAEFYLPLLQKYKDFRRSIVLVDRVPEQADAVAKEFGIDTCRFDHLDVPGDVEAAIITTPHNLHAEHAIHFLRHGCHVLVEKPMAMTMAEAVKVLDAASASGRVLMVNNYRRLFPSYRGVRDMLRSGELGGICKVTVNDGAEFSWKSRSSFYVRDPRVRGVLLDRGAHTVDILCWWLGERPQVVQARWDAQHGVEGLMDVQLQSGRAAINMRFSRFYRLNNDYLIECDKGQIEGRLFDFARFCVRRDERTKRIVAGKARPHYEYSWELIRNFIATIQGRESPLFFAEEVVPALGVIDECYGAAVRYDMPWYSEDPNLAFMKDDVGRKPSLMYRNR